jgi:hypothetical protein
MMSLVRASLRSSYHEKRPMRCWIAGAALRLKILIYATAVRFLPRFQGGSVALQRDGKWPKTKTQSDAVRDIQMQPAAH